MNFQEYFIFFSMQTNERFLNFNNIYFKWNIAETIPVIPTKIYFHEVYIKIRDIKLRTTNIISD